jgi:hypothetical protein
MSASADLVLFTRRSIYKSNGAPRNRQAKCFFLGRRFLQARPIAGADSKHSNYYRGGVSCFWSGSGDALRRIDLSP